MRYKRLSFEPGFEIEMLTIIEQVEDKNGRTCFLCKCTCGNKVEVLGKCLNAKRPRKSCGCLIPMMAMTHSLSDEKDLVGLKFDMLTVLQRDFQKFGIDKNNSWWRCLCDCGNEKVVKRSVLLNKSMRKSCGCLFKQRHEEFIKNFCTKKPKKTYEEFSVKTCRLCKKELLIKNFHKKLDGFAARCKECCSKNKK